MCSQQAPKAKPRPLHLRIFLSSPGDVADERALARRLIKEELAYERPFRDRVTFDVVSWDDPAAPGPMPAMLTPQEAVNRGLAKPSDCDIVVVILWSRMGTPLPPEYRKPTGEPYLSGTEWEFENAIRSEHKPEVLVYRRMGELNVAFGDPQLTEKLEQFKRIEQFFDGFINPDGSLRGGFNTYATPGEFKELLAKHLRDLVWHRIFGLPELSTPANTALLSWEGSPYPGLRAFTFEEAAIFFGRGRETDALIAQLRDPEQRFVAVVGASGTGKSSLIHAGLLPRLADGAIEGSQNWRVLTFTPGIVGDDPFLALAAELVGVLPASERKSPGELATMLAKAPQRIANYAAIILSVLLGSAALVLVVDQLEELFTLTAAEYRAAFIDLLAHAAHDPHLRVLTTLRADFLLQCTAEPKLAALLQRPAGNFPLGPPGPVALVDMIRKPAERAGLELEEGLIDEILKDAGSDPGVLPLIAFCLNALYYSDAPRHRLTMAAYEALGRLRGAVGRQANALLENLRRTEGASLDTALPQLFRALVHVDTAGTVTRRRVSREMLGTEPSMPRLIEMLIQGRLLFAESADGHATFTLAHEALLATWPDLQNWLYQTQRLNRVKLNISAKRGVGQV